MNYEETSYWLLGTEDNVEPNILFDAIVLFYSESFIWNSMLTSITSKYCTLQCTESARERGKAPNFLKLQAPEVRLFPADSVSALQRVS